MLQLFQTSLVRLIYVIRDLIEISTPLEMRVSTLSVSSENETKVKQTEGRLPH